MRESGRVRDRAEPHAFLATTAYSLSRSGRRRRGRCRADGRRRPTRTRPRGTGRAATSGNRGCWCVGSTQNVFSACGACGFTVSATNRPPGRSLRVRELEEPHQLARRGCARSPVRRRRLRAHRRRGAPGTRSRRQARRSCPFARQRSTMPSSRSTPVPSTPRSRSRSRSSPRPQPASSTGSWPASSSTIDALALPDPLLGPAEDLLEGHVGALVRVRAVRGSRAPCRRTGARNCSSTPSGRVRQRAASRDHVLARPRRATRSESSALDEVLASRSELELVTLACAVARARRSRPGCARRSSAAGRL